LIEPLVTFPGAMLATIKTWPDAGEPGFVKLPDMETTVGQAELFTIIAVLLLMASAVTISGLPSRLTSAAMISVGPGATPILIGAANVPLPWPNITETIDS
jgi:hypothetical protein